MAAPTVATQTTADQQEGAVTTAGTSHTVTYPTSAASGNLIVGFIAFAVSQSSVTMDDGFTVVQLNPDSGNGNLYMFWKQYAGTESTTGVITSGASSKSVWTVFRITGHYNRQPAKGAAATGSSATPDPPNVAVPGNADDVLVFAVMRQDGEIGDTDAEVNTGPSTYTFTAATAGHQKSTGTATAATTNCLIATAYKGFTAATSENPGTFGVDTSKAWQANTVAVRSTVPVYEAAASLDATGDIASSGLTVRAAAASIDATATIAASGEVVSGGATFERAASLDATADIVSAPQRDLLRAASLDATADIASVGLTIRQAAASLDATANVISAGQRGLLRAAAVDATAAISSSGLTIRAAAASLDAVATITAAGSVVGGAATHERAASLDATAAIAASGFTIRQASASLDATATIAAAAESFHVLQAAVSLDATAAIAGAGLTIRERSASVDATAALEVAGFQRDHVRSASLDAVADIAVAGQIEGEIIAAASFDATALIAVSGMSYNPTEDWDLPPPGQPEWPVSVGSEWPVKG